MVNKKIEEFEPIRKNRFVVEFPERYNIPSYACFKVDLPEFKNEKFEKMEIYLREMVGNFHSLKLMIDEKKEKGDNFNCSIVFKTLDPTGVEVGKIVYNFVVFDVNFGVFDYSSNELSETKLTIYPVSVIIS